VSFEEFRISQVRQQLFRREILRGLDAREFETNRIAEHPHGRALADVDRVAGERRKSRGEVREERVSNLILCSWNE
jgi:hypothetical protein